MDLLREYSFSECLRTIVRVYATHFRLLFAVCAVPNLLLGSLWTFWEFAAETAETPSFERWDLLFELVNIVVAGAATVAVSDICLGNPAGALQSYVRLSRIRGVLLWTSLLVTALSFAPLLLIGVSPGGQWDIALALLAVLLVAIMVSVLALTIAVVVLERKAVWGP